ncbi:MAG TPA: ABC-F family ATP-binding cassette domain-containing protein [Solirubrobacteraceae bacterium]|jgi:ATP-binding cassette subfamily F protein 3|nr:ABC-F family ATP-binding cassette domain-containing protein [Solirubrobacteraceae bacterium]
MAVIIASDLSKDISGEPLLRGISFKLERRDRMTLSGRNGAGKTTLLRMIAGEASIDGGELVLAKGTKMALHDQRPPRDQRMTLRDYVLSGAPELIALEGELQRLEQRMAEGDYEEPTLTAYADAQAALEHAGGYTWRERALATLNGLGFTDDSVLDRKLETFSGGELTRASLGRALAGSPDLLLLDEPTNHLDIAALEWLEAHLNALDAAVILIAHDRWFLESVATSVLELEAGRGKFFPGSWHQWRTEKAQRELALGRAIERQQTEIARLEKFVTRFRAGTRARQAQSRQKRLDKIDRIERNERDGDGLAFAFKPPERSGRVVFEFEDGRVSIGDRVLLHDAELWLERGEHVSVVGPNGAGKTTLIETLAGARPFADDGADARDATGMAVRGGQQAAATGEGPIVKGKLLTGHNVKVGFLSQHSEDLHAGNARTVVEACTYRTGLTPANSRALLGRFLFSGEEADKPLEALSGGERQRLSLAILVQSGANVLILDEPTNHLDVESREALEDALGEFSGSLLLISHDRALLDAVGTRTVAFEDATLHSYVGGWPEYLRVREERAADEAAAKQAVVAARVAAKPKPVAKRATGAASKNGAAKLEQQIEQAEAALRGVEDELTDPGAWSTPERSAESTARHEAAKQAVDELYSRYEALEGVNS